MKLKTLIALSVVITLTFFSCKKTDSDTATDEIEATFELSGDQAVADNLDQDANDVLNEAALDKGVMGNSFVMGTNGTMGILGCATVTMTPLIGFPKNIIIDFGAGCTSPNGIFRKGKINVTLSDSLRKSGSIAVMTFDNYYVSGFKKEGTITWTNTSTAGAKSWNRTVTDGKIIAPNGNYWLHTANIDIVQTAGVATPQDLLDDIFSITGVRTVTNAAGKTRNSTTLTPLQKKTICENIDQGTVKVQGTNHYAVIDFGNGTCDRIATISIDGRPARTFILR